MTDKSDVTTIRNVNDLTGKGQIVFQGLLIGKIYGGASAYRDTDDQDQTDLTMHHTCALACDEG